MRKRLIAILLGVVVAVFGAIAISRASGSPPPVNRPDLPKKHVAERHRVTVARALLHRFAVLRAARPASAVSLPTGLAEDFTESGTEVTKYQLEPTQARALKIGAKQAWVVPGAGGVCLTIDQGQTDSSVCNSTQIAAKGGVLLMSRSPKAVSVYGLVPDGDSVTVRVGGSERPVPVASSAFGYEGGPSEAVSIHAPDGAVVETQSLEG
jgi:hypothetical protein